VGGEVGGSGGGEARGGRRCSGAGKEWDVGGGEGDVDGGSGGGGRKRCGVRVEKTRGGR